uniref:RRM domain-containing protein n=1 Tax=Daucus carota subsp. sativus TaxID=79200 RepID=A0A164ZZN2_DAUCS
MRRERNEERENSNFKFSNNQRSDDRNFADTDQWFKVTRHHVTGKRITVPISEPGKPVKGTGGERTYAQVLQQGVAESSERQQAKEDPIKNRIYRNGCISVMVNNIPDNASRRDLWLLFNGGRRIKDIILPRKKSKFNTRFGFLVVASLGDAHVLISKFNGMVCGQYRLRLLLAKDSRATGTYSDSNGNTRWMGATDNSQNKLQANRIPAPVALITSKRSKEVLVEQPSFRTVKGVISPDKQSMLDRSMIGFTKEVIQEDMLQEKILARGYNFIKVSGLTHNEFLISPVAEEDKEMDLSGLNDLFEKFKKVEDSDLVVPRVAWILCDGLPLSVWNKTTLEAVLGDWGTLVSEFSDSLDFSNVHNGAICISTWKVLPIEETLKVMVNGLGFWVKIREMRDSNRSFSNSKSQEDGLYNESIENAYSLAILEEPRGDDSVVLNGNLQSDDILAGGMLAMNLGRKVGRPRKRAPTRNVFEVKGFRKIKSRYNKMKNRQIGAAQKRSRLRSDKMKAIEAAPPSMESKH